MKKFSKLLTVLLFLGLTVVVAACGGGKESSSGSETPSTSSSANSGTSNGSSIEIKGNTESLLVGDEVTLTVQRNGVTGDVVWSSDAPEVASVNANGVVLGLSAGEADITATVGSSSDTYTVTVYSDATLYWLATHGYVYDEDNAKNKAVSCTEDGVMVFVTESGEEYVYNLPKGHVWVDVVGSEIGERTCNRCGAQTQNTLVEIEYTDGIDFSEYYTESPVDTVEVNGEPITHEDGKITLSKVTAHKIEYVVTYEDTTVRTIQATVWSSIISNAAELVAANTHAYENPTKAGQWLGWFKMDADVDMSGVNWAKENAIGYGSTLGRGLSFSGMFDGCGYTISNFAVDAKEEALFTHTGAEAVIENIRFENAANNATMCKAAILVLDIYGGKFEDITIELTYGSLSRMTYGQFNAAVYCTMATNLYPVTLKNITVINMTDEAAWENAIKDESKQYGFCALGVISTYKQDGQIDLSKVLSFENITLVGYPKNYTFLNSNGTPTAISAVEDVASIGFPVTNFNVYDKKVVDAKIGDEVDLSEIFTDAVTSVKAGFAGQASDAVTVTNNKFTVAGKATANKIYYEVIISQKTYQLIINTNFTVVNKVTVETDVATGLDLAAQIDKDDAVQSVQQLVGGTYTDLTGLTNNKVVYTPADASMEAKVYRITTEKGSVYEISVTVWSLIINTPEELTQMNTYANLNTTNNCTYGYFKLGNTIDMSETEWEASYTLGWSTYSNGTTGALNSAYGKKGFVGVFDGCNYEIQNFTISYAYSALIYRLAKINDEVCGTVKNVKFTNAVHNVKSSGAIVSYYVYGGLVENVTIGIEFKWVSVGTYGLYAGALFSEFNTHASMGVITIKNVTITNNTDATAWKSMVDTAAAAAKPRNYGFSAIGFLNVYNANGNFDYTDNIIVEGLTVTGFDTHVLFLKTDANESKPATSLTGFATIVTKS